MPVLQKCWGTRLAGSADLRKYGPTVRHGYRLDRESLVLDGFCGPNAGQDHLLHPLLPGGRESARLGIMFSVAMKFAEGVRVAHPNELGVLLSRPSP